MIAVVLVAHGSRDPAAAGTVRAVAAAVAAARPDVDVRAAFLDHTPPRPERVLADLSGRAAVTIVVPLLLSDAFHTGVDLPGVLARTPGGAPPVADVLGPVAGVVPAQVVAALRRRLPGWPRLDAIVLAAAGTRYLPARQAVAQVAHALGSTLGLRCRVGYAAGAGPTPGEATALLRRQGARRVGMAAYFMATGHLYRAAMASARAAGAVAIAAPLGAAPELTALIVARIERTVAGQQKGPGVIVSEASPLAC